MCSNRMVIRIDVEMWYNENLMHLGSMHISFYVHNFYIAHSNCIEPFL